MKGGLDHDRQDGNPGAGDTPQDAAVQTAVRKPRAVFPHAFSLFLFSGIGILLRKVQSGGVPTVADSYGSVLLRGGASAYVVVGIAAFAVGVTVTVICIRLKNKSTDRTVSREEREDEMK